MMNTHWRWTRSHLPANKDGLATAAELDMMVGGVCMTVACECPEVGVMAEPCGETGCWP